MRSFIGIGLDEQTRREIVAFTAPLREAGLPVRWVAESNLHLTVQFLGEIYLPQQEAITAALRSPPLGVSPFTLRFQGAGAFLRGTDVSIVWVGVELARELMLLVARLGERLAPLGFPPEARPFTPHLTVGRARGTCPAARLEPALKTLENRPVSQLEVSGFTLYQSRMDSGGSASYTSLQEFAFG